MGRAGATPVEGPSKYGKYTLITLNGILALIGLLGLLANGGTDHVTSTHLDQLTYTRFSHMTTIMTVMSATLLFGAILGFLAATGSHTFFVIAYFLLTVGLIGGEVSLCALMRLWFVHLCGSKGCFIGQSILLCLEVPFQIAALVCSFVLYRHLLFMKKVGRDAPEQHDKLPRGTSYKKSFIKSFKKEEEPIMTNFDALFDKYAGDGIGEEIQGEDFELPKEGETLTSLNHLDESSSSGADSILINNLEASRL